MSALVSKDLSREKKQLFGFLNIYKPVGMTSHDVVAALRRVTKIRQIGHTGTLDPFAEGVLPICVGKATRLIEYLQDDKEYLATVQFGASTNTFDLDGEKTSVSGKKVTKSEVEEALKTFSGEISQLPPIFSAIKVKGKKLYEYARKGEEVEIHPRKVVIENIELKEFDEENQQAQILIKCSKGTYIRSIANDLGQNLGCGGYLVKLIRTQAGSFRVEDSFQLDTVEVEKNFVNPLDVLNLPKIAVKDKDLTKIKNGMPIEFSPREDIKFGNFVILVYNNVEICAVGVADNDKIKLKKVFL